MNKKKIEQAIRIILKEIGEDVNREGIQSTPIRIARLYESLFYGYTKKLVVMNEKERNTDIHNSDIIPITIFKSNSNDMLIRSSKFISHCEHHMAVFPGVAYIGIIPNKNLLGMNKIDKIVKYFAARLQIQERMTSQIADWIWNNIKPKGVICIIRADHFCAKLQNDDGKFTTSAMRGCFKNTDTRMEFLNLIK